MCATDKAGNQLIQKGEQLFKVIQPYLILQEQVSGFCIDLRFQILVSAEIYASDRPKSVTPIQFVYFSFYFDNVNFSFQFCTNTFSSLSQKALSLVAFLWQA